MIVHVPINISEGASPSEMQAIAKAVHEYGNKLVAAGKKTSSDVKAPKTQKSGSALGAGDDDAQAIAGRLAKMLESADPATADEAAKEKIFQGIIGYRKIARQLAEETRATVDKAVARYSNQIAKRK
jgi:hypothetical protein